MVLRSSMFFCKVWSTCDDNLIDLTNRWKIFRVCIFFMFGPFWLYLALEPIFLKSGGRNCSGQFNFLQNPTFFKFFQFPVFQNSCFDLEIIVKTLCLIMEIMFFTPNHIFGSKIIDFHEISLYFDLFSSNLVIFWPPGPPGGPGGREPPRVSLPKYFRNTFLLPYT